MEEWPKYDIRLEHVPGTKGGSWFASLWRQEKKYAKWEQLNKGQGKTLEIALNACAQGAKLQALKYPELAT
jgi:hypothetical protein